MAAALNARFRGGRAANALADVGVLIHQFDSYDDDNAVPRRPPWERCRRWECWVKSDRFSAMSVSASSTPDPSGKWPLFSVDLAGLVLSPRSNRLLCAYPYDGGTNERHCDGRGVSDGLSDGRGCVPGCVGFRGSYHIRSGATWCTTSHGYPCARPPSHLREALEIRDRVARRPEPWRWSEDYYVPTRQVQERAPDGTWRFYDELIFEQSAFERALPGSIEAVFYIADDVHCDDTRPQPWLSAATTIKCEGYARWVHEQIRRTWGERAAAAIPLLRLDIGEWRNPFRAELEGG